MRRSRKKSTNCQKRRFKQKETKKDSRAQMYHSMRRFKERYGRKLEKNEYREMCLMIKGEQSEFIFKQTCTRILHRLIFSEVYVYVVYDKSRGEIATFLTEEMVEELLEGYEAEEKAVMEGEPASTFRFLPKKLDVFSLDIEED